jgi:hypothetical protein
MPLRSDAFQATALYLFREHRRAGPALDFKNRDSSALIS